MQIHHLKGYMQDMYLVEYPDKLLLLDGGCRNDVELVSKFITNHLGRKLTDLKLIVVTHPHPDHAGGIQNLRKHTNCKVATGKRPDTNNKNWYSGLGGITNYGIDLLLSHWVASKMKKPFEVLLYNPYAEIDYYLEDGETLPRFPDWQALHTAGHTDRDITLYHRASNTAYTADLIIKTRKGYIYPFPISLPSAYFSSLERIKKLNLNATLLAHGGKVVMDASEITNLIERTPNKVMNNKTAFNFQLRRLKKQLRHQFKN